MNRPWAALGLVLALCVIMPRSAQAQGSQKPGKPTIGQNYPNPFNPETFVPFTVGEVPNCPEGGKQYRVTMKVYNQLGQVVAIPVMYGAAGGVSGGTPLDRVLLTCGSYRARWDGKTIFNGREAASGIYRIVIDQDGVLR